MSLKNQKLGKHPTTNAECIYESIPPDQQEVRTAKNQPIKSNQVKVREQKNTRRRRGYTTRLPSQNPEPIS
uniref:Uncharacterized protein n=1 Tax=Rhizophora mucronata TaxID=61149 RepID=A0A2P2JS39_RHIMU